MGWRTVTLESHSHYYMELSKCAVAIETNYGNILRMNIVHSNNWQYHGYASYQ